jgi:hypothetical protein
MVICECHAATVSCPDGVMVKPMGALTGPPSGAVVAVHCATRRLESRVLSNEPCPVTFHVAGYALTDPTTLGAAPVSVHVCVSWCEYPAAWP